MDVEEKLFALMAIAEEHQHAVGDVLEAMKSERLALAADRSNLDGAVQKLIQSIEPHKQALESAAKRAVQDSLRDAPKTSVQAFHEASRPFFQGLQTAAEEMAGVGERINKVGSMISWKLGVVALIAVGASGFAAWTYVRWGQHQVESLQSEKQALQQEMIELSSQVAALERKGGRIKFSTCGPGKRLCIQASSNQGAGVSNWIGPWSDQENKQQYVIPQGY